MNKKISNLRREYQEIYINNVPTVICFGVEQFPRLEFYTKSHDRYAVHDCMPIHFMETWLHKSIASGRFHFVIIKH